MKAFLSKCVPENYSSLSVLCYVLLTVFIFFEHFNDLDFYLKCLNLR